jgi:hypothetical protein
MSALHFAAAPLRYRLDAIMAKWQRLIAWACDSYRPELHYMRGPGPKWHARHQGRIELQA